MVQSLRYSSSDKELLYAYPSPGYLHHAQEWYPRPSKAPCVCAQGPDKDRANAPHGSRPGSGFDLSNHSYWPTLLIRRTVLVANLLPKNIRKRIPVSNYLNTKSGISNNRFQQISSRPIPQPSGQRGWLLAQPAIHAPLCRRISSVSDNYFASQPTYESSVNV